MIEMVYHHAISSLSKQKQNLTEKKIRSFYVPTLKLRSTKTRQQESLSLITLPAGIIPRMEKFLLPSEDLSLSLHRRGSQQVDEDVLKNKTHDLLHEERNFVPETSLEDHICDLEACTSR